MPIAARQLPQCPLTVLTAAFLLLLSSPVFAQQPATGSNAPSVQSSGKKVHTPIGDMAEECVHQIPHGSKIREDGVTVNYPDQSIHTFPACTRPPTLTSGSGVTWVEAGLANTNKPSDVFSYISSQWSVPAAPVSQNGQTIYLWNGVSGATCVLQPVLGWNGTLPDTWAVDSWICCPGSATGCYHSTSIPVNVGDTITGTTSLNSQTGDWTITTQDNTNGQQSTLSVTTTTANGVQSIAYGGLLETYSVTGCSDYPLGPFSFSNATIVDNEGQFVAQFAPTIYNKDHCGEGVTSSPGTVSLDILQASPDGSTISGGTGYLTTAAGTWTFGSANSSDPGTWFVLLNNGSTNGSGSKMEVANGGQLYVLNVEWSRWNGSGWTNVGTTIPDQTNGACGSANNATTSTAPAGAGLCSVGTASTVSIGPSWTWTCAGSGGGSTASCSAPNSSAVNGQCGSATAGGTTTPSGTSLCAAGSATAVYGSGPWTWGCTGLNGGSTVGCLAPLDGSCGSANGTATSSAPSGTGLCTTGTASAVSGTGPWTWTCAGSGSGSTASLCSAPKSGISPDGSTVSAGSGGTLTTSAGTWSFSTTTAGGGYLILLNGSSAAAANGSAVLLLIYNGGKTYVENKVNGWFLWSGSGWTRIAGDPRTTPPYEGCWTDSASRALPHELITSGATIATCTAAAAKAGYTYAGLQYGGQCWAGNTLGFSLVDTIIGSSSACNQACSANSAEYCGSSYHNSIFLATQ